MKVEPAPTGDATLARPLAAEDLRCGDFVSILHEVVEYPSFFWSCDPQLWPPEEPVRMQLRASDGGMPLKVKAICLPFVFVKSPCGKHRLLDVRQQHLVRLSRDYAQQVWTAMRKQVTTSAK